MAKKSAEERFFEKVNKTDDCWEWTATKNNKGYGMFYPGYGKEKVLAHRFSWEFHNYPSPIPKGKNVLHVCDNPGCVNPAHFFIGSHLDNMLDKENKGRGNHPCGDGRPLDLTDEEIEDIIKRYTNGTCLRSLGRDYGIDKATIGRVLRKNGIEVYDRNLKVFTDEETSRICEMRKSGMALKDIATHFSVDRSVISRILKPFNIEVYIKPGPKT
jgi:hypothetical protein